MPKAMSFLLIASIYCLCVSVFGMMNRFFDETGMLLAKRPLTDTSLPSDIDLTA
jgi:hypothetical protein